MITEAMKRSEFDERTDRARDFARLCEMPEFKNTIVKFFDDLAKNLQEQHLLQYHVDQVRDAALIVSGQNYVLELYKDQVKSWIADKDLDASKLTLLEE